MRLYFEQLTSLLEMVFRVHLTLPRHEIVDRDEFYEVPFFGISLKNLLAVGCDLSRVDGASIT